jgi:hypothetical protein
LGLVFVVAGACMAAFAVWVRVHRLEQYDSDPMAAIAGGAFLALAGALLVMPGRFARWHGLLGAACVTSMAWVFDWVAFGPAERPFTGNLSVGRLGTAGHPAERYGRIVFGIAAVLLDVAALWLWARQLRSPPAPSSTSDQSARRRVRVVPR